MKAYDIRGSQEPIIQVSEVIGTGIVIIVADIEGAAGKFDRLRGVALQMTGEQADILMSALVNRDK